MKVQIVAGVSSKGYALQSVITFDEEVVKEWKEHFASRDRLPEVWEFNYENFMKTVKNGASATTVYYNLDEVGRMVEFGYPEVKDFPAELKEFALRCYHGTFSDVMEDVMIYKRKALYQ